MSAQKLSALIPLLKFYSVVSLNFKCLDWLVRLKFVFGKNRYYESVWDWVFYLIFFEKLWKILSLFAKKSFFSKTFLPRAGLRGGGQGRAFLLQGFKPLPTHRAPLCTILRYLFLVTDPKTFRKAPVYTNFVGERAKNAIFWSKFSKKCLKTSSGLFSQIFACGAEIFTKTGSF